MALLDYNYYNYIVIIIICKDMTTNIIQNHIKDTIHTNGPQLGTVCYELPSALPTENFSRGNKLLEGSKNTSNN